MWARGTDRRPVRTWRAGRAIGVAAIVTASIASAAGTASAGTSPTPGTAAQVVALVKASVSITTLDSALKSQLATAATDNVGTKMDVPATCSAVGQTGCVFGDLSGTKTVVVFGDSHARMWLPAVLPYLDQQGDKVSYLGEDGCSAVTITLTNALTPPNCTALRTEEIASINAMRPAPVAIIISDRTSDNLVPPHKPATAAEWKAGLITTIHELPSTSKVVIIGDIQAFSDNPVLCIAAYERNVQKQCSIANPNKSKLGLESAEEAAAKATKAAYIDPTSWLCTKKRCSPVIGNFIAYWDTSHVSFTYAEYLSGVMGTALGAAI